jgi:hypothetical protein
MNIMNMNLDEKGQILNLELEKSIQQYIFEKKILPL